LGRGACSAGADAGQSHPLIDGSGPWCTGTTAAVIRSPFPRPGALRRARPGHAGHPTDRSPPTRSRPLVGAVAFVNPAPTGAVAACRAGPVAGIQPAQAGRRGHWRS